MTVQLMAAISRQNRLRRPMKVKDLIVDIIKIITIKG